MSQNVTMFDGFCGAGGSSTGAVAAGVEVKIAVNHWALAIETHNTNHPNTDHDLADMQKIHPSRYERTDIAWFSPECTNHSLAKGQKRKNLAQLDLWGDDHIDPAEERSRATMREVVEFSAYHQYEIVIVENVVDIRHWEHYDAWLQAMINLGYDYKPLYLNAMFFGVPQSRDRIYVVFWRKGNKAPDLDFRPYAFCADHGVVGAVQSFKKAQQWGRYGKRRQYVYCCPTCGRVIEPFTLPASDVIDWSIPSQRIGDRKHALKPKTTLRILEGLRRFAPEAAVLDISYSHAEHAGKVRLAEDPLPTQTTRQTFALINPFMVNYMNQLTPPRIITEPLYTVSTLNGIGMVTPPFIAELYGASEVREIHAPLSGILGSNHHALISPYLINMKNSDGKSNYVLPSIPIKDPLSTIVAAGSQHGLVTPSYIMAYYGAGPTYADIDQPIPTVTGKLRHALVQPEDMIDDCGFRMLEPEELKLGMSFPKDYIVLGNKREKVKQVGNAVCVNVAQAIVQRCVESLSA